MAISDTLHFYEMPLRPWTSDSKCHTYIYIYIYTHTYIYRNGVYGNVNRLAEQTCELPMRPWISESKCQPFWASGSLVTNTSKHVRASSNIPFMPY